MTETRRWGQSERHPDMLCDMPLDYRRFVLQRADGTPVATVPAARGETLFDAVQRAGRSIRTHCRGSTICGQCWVIVEDGLDALPPASPSEQELLDQYADDDPRARLACQIEHPETPSAIVVSTVYW